MASARSEFVIATLAIAIGANALIFSVVDGVLLRPLPLRDADRLVAVTSTGAGPGGVSMLDLVDWRRLLFGIQPTDVTTYGIVCVTLLSGAALASWLPARRAAAIDPVIAIRDAGPPI